MKRTLVTLATLLAVSVATPAFAQATPPATAKPQAPAAATTDPTLASSYVGKWTVALTGPDGAAMSLGLDVKIDASNVVTGMMTGGPSGDTAIKGEFKDAKLGFGISVDAGGQMLEVWFEGVVKDGKMAGTASIGDQMTLPFTAERAKGL
jgi:hypothetical protein